MTQPESDADYSARMDALMLRLGKFLDGESAHDVAMVSAVSVAWSCYIGEESHQKRWALLEHMIAFARSELQNMESSEGYGRLWTH